MTHGSSNHANGTHFELSSYGHSCIRQPHAIECRAVLQNIIAHIVPAVALTGLGNDINNRQATHLCQIGVARVMGGYPHYSSAAEVAQHLDACYQKQNGFSTECTHVRRAVDGQKRSGQWMHGLQ